MIKVFECPICKSELERETIHDGSETVVIKKSGDLYDEDSQTNGGIQVRCTKDASHKLGEDLISAVIDLV